MIGKFQWLFKSYLSWSENRNKFVYFTVLFVDVARVPVWWKSRNSLVYLRNLGIFTQTQTVTHIEVQACVSKQKFLWRSHVAHVTIQSVGLWKSLRSLRFIDSKRKWAHTRIHTHSAHSHTAVHVCSWGCGAVVCCATFFYAQLTQLQVRHAAKQTQRPPATPSYTHT